MKKVAWILACGALVMACGGNNNRNDAGAAGNDAGGIVLMDSGPTTMRDSGPPRRDTGAMATSCGPWGGLTATSVEAVPASCLPRCSSATLTAVNACMDGTCLNSALMADTTPSISMSFEGAMGTTTLDLDCGTCFDLQRFHCFSQVCPAEATPVLVCDSTMDADMCMGEVTALQTCLDGIATGSAQEMTLQTCFNDEVGACFDAGGGFLPGAQRFPGLELLNRVSAPRAPIAH